MSGTMRPANCPDLPARMDPPGQLRLAPLMSSQNMAWQTPDDFLDLVRKVDVIGLDPATTRDNPTGAEHTYTPIEDGLSQPWGGAGLVYINPEYGRALGAWAAKIAEEARAGVEIIALVPARPDTRWFRTMVDAASATLFWSGRLKFKGAKDPAPFPSAVFYFGPRRVLFARAFAGKGWFR